MKRKTLFINPGKINPGTSSVLSLPRSAPVDNKSDRKDRKFDDLLFLRKFSLNCLSPGNEVDKSPTLPKVVTAKYIVKRPVLAKNCFPQLYNRLLDKLIFERWKISCEN